MFRTSIAIAGGGPAGAMLAAELAGRGCLVALIDEKPAWEKPCGGGVTAKSLQRYEFLHAGRCNWVRECEIASPGGRRALLRLDRPIAIYARIDLNGMLLERARTRGAEIIRDRVTDARAAAGGWHLQLRDGAACLAERLAVAAGARSRLLLGAAHPPAAADLMATAGYYIAASELPWPPERMIVSFLPDLEGYIWSFPRSDHASVGICGRCGRQSTATLRRRLEEWLDAHGIAAWRQSEFYSHLLPAPGGAALRDARLEGAIDGARWARVGDAAALVDPITGEGLYYALRSAELLAEAWTGSGPEDAYSQSMAGEIVEELAAAAAISDRFYSGRFLGQSVLDRMTQFTAGSRQFRRLMCDLFAGAQSYRSLRRRLYRNLPVTALELAVGAFRSGTTAATLAGPAQL